jgi:hypothetical protein
MASSTKGRMNSESEPRFVPNSAMRIRGPGVLTHLSGREPSQAPRAERSHATSEGPVRPSLD